MKTTLFALAVLVLCCVGSTTAQIYWSSSDSVMQTIATLDAYLFSGDDTTVLWFEWGLTERERVSSPLIVVPPDLGDIHVRFQVQDLTPQTTYFYRTIVEVNGGVYVDSGSRFTTLPTGVIGGTLLPVTIGNTANARNTLVLGVHPSATYCIDGSVGEWWLPPTPPLGVFDVRFIESSDELTCFDQGLYRDFRWKSDAAQQEFFKIRIQSANNTYPITLSWPDASSWSLGPLILRDAFTGTVVNVDMTAQTSFVVTNTSVKELWVVSGVAPSLPATPEVRTLAPLVVGQDAATLHGVLNPHAEGATAWFEWGTTTAYGNATGHILWGAVESFLGNPVEIGDLLPGTEYHYRLLAENSVGTGVGLDQTFRTVRTSDTVSVTIPLTCGNGGDVRTVYFGNHPLATSCIDPLLDEEALPPPTDDSRLEMRFVGEVLGEGCLGQGTHLDVHPIFSLDQVDTFYVALYPGYSSGQYGFSWPDLSSLFSGSVIMRDAPSGETFTVDMKATTSYSTWVPGIWRIMIIASGPIVGPRPPMVALPAPANVSGTSASLAGSVTPNGYSTLSWFEWGLTGMYGNVSGTQVVGNGLTPVDVIAQLQDGLAPSTEYHFRLVAASSSGTIRSQDYTFTTSEATAAGDPDGLPERFALRQNYPNPFNPGTVISYDLPEAGHVRLRIYNLFGQVVATLVDEVQSAGMRSVEFLARDIPSGVYFYSLSAGQQSATMKMLYLR